MNAEAKVTDVFSRSSSNTCRTSRTRIQTTGARAYAMTKKDIDHYVDECNAVQINYWSCGQASSVWSSRSVGPLTVQLHFAYRPASIIISRSEQSSLPEYSLPRHRHRNMSAVTVTRYGNNTTNMMKFDALYWQFYFLAVIRCAFCLLFY